MCFASNELGVAARNQASDGGSKKRSVLCNFLSQPARSASNEGELHASFLTQTCARCNGLARNRRAITSHRARAVTCCQGAGNKPDFHGADRKRAFRQKMDGRAADRQLQGPERQAGDQAAAGYLLSCLAAAKASVNTGIKHEGAAAAPAAVGGRARSRAPRSSSNRMSTSTSGSSAISIRRRRPPSESAVTGDAARDACRRNRGARRKLAATLNRPLPMAPPS